MIEHVCCEATNPKTYTLRYQAHPGTARRTLEIMQYETDQLQQYRYIKPDDALVDFCYALRHTPVYHMRNGAFIKNNPMMAIVTLNLYMNEIARNSRRGAGNVIIMDPTLYVEIASELPKLGSMVDVHVNTVMKPGEVLIAYRGSATDGGAGYFYDKATGEHVVVEHDSDDINYYQLIQFDFDAEQPVNLNWTR